jgi:tricorn protease
VKRLSLLLVLLSSLLLSAAAANAAAPDQPGYLARYADIGGGNIVFTYEGDLWLVPEQGGEARRLTTHAGNEVMGKISADGKLVAFTAEYDGGNDIYVMDVLGGEPKRLTWHPAADTMLDWCPDGSGVVISSNREYPNRGQLFKVFLDGGMEQRLPVDRGSLASMAPDGSGLAYNRINRQTATWKRYEGGMAQDVWVKDFKGGDITKITDWSGTDSFPMWGQGAIYFISDREDGTLNVYAYDTATKQTKRMTTFKDYDVKWPSYGEGKIVFQYGAGLSVLDCATGQVRKVPVTVHSDRRHVREEFMDDAPSIGAFGLSPGGERAVLESRGELLNLPAKDGDALNLTQSSGSREKYGTWSPDGGRIAFVSDRTGEEQIYVMPAKGGAAKQLTTGDFGFTMQPVWSPDGKSLIFADKFLRLNLVDVATGKTSVVVQGEYDDAWERWGIMDYVWSSDSRWIAYTKQTGNMNEEIWLHDTKTGTATMVTDNMYNSWSPSFSRDGKYLYFLSNRTFNPIMCRIDQQHVFLDVARPYVALLQAGGRSPFYKGDTDVPVTVLGATTEGAKDVPAAKKSAGKGAASSGTPAVNIDLAGLGDRILACEGVDAGNWFRLEACDGGFLMLRKNDPEFLKYQNVDDRTGGELDLVKYDLGDKELTDLMSGIANYHQSADGKKLIFRAGSKYGIVDSGKAAKTSDGKLATNGVKLRVDHLAEYRQMFDETWRIQRNFFYDKNMQGTDWQAMHDKYAPFVAGCGSRGDLSYLLGEMISELNLGHTYVQGGDFEPGPAPIRTGLLGCTFTREGEQSYYRFAGIVPGVAWDPKYVSPLREPGVDVKNGDYLVAIDGVQVKYPDNVYAHLVDKAGQNVTLTVASDAAGKVTRTVRLKTLRSEGDLRYRAWVDANLDYVTKKSGGDIAYLHIPNMGEEGLVEFGRSYYAQTEKPAMIIDERYNGGGFTGDMIIDRLERVLWSMTQPREGKSGRNPERAFHGPLVVLINEDTGSNGEFFAEAIKRLKLAKVIGMRTWGGSIGIEPHQDLVDGGGITPPQFGLFGLDGSWPIEGWGVDPDIIVMNMPKDVVDGKDTQLDFAIDYLQKELATNGAKWQIPAVPAYPDKSKPRMSADYQGK